MISTKHTFIKFALVGALNTLVGMGMIFVAWHFFGFSDLAANLTGYAAGFCCSYLLNRRWTFDDRSAVSRSLWRFILVCAVAYGANLIVLFATRNAMGPETFLPHVAGSITYTVAGYLGSRYFAFKKVHGARLADAITPP